MWYYCIKAGAQENSPVDVAGFERILQLESLHATESDALQSPPRVNHRKGTPAKINSYM